MNNQLKEDLKLLNRKIGRSKRYLKEAESVLNRIINYVGEEENKILENKKRFNKTMKKLEDAM